MTLQFASGQFSVGLTADCEGKLYTGVYGSSQVIQIDPMYVQMHVTFKRAGHY